MSDEPDWAEILETIYRRNIIWSYDTDIEDDHPVVSAVGMDANSVQENLALLSQTGLVGRIHVGRQADISRPEMGGLVGISENARRKGTHIGLTPRGFHVAHEREVMNQEKKEENRRIQSQNKINSAIGILTLGLLFINFADTWVSAALTSRTDNWPLTIWVALGSGAIIIVVITILLNRNNLLDSQSLIESFD
ncbi:hypothetical protein NKF06_12270 [Haloferax sp. AB510]|uniref:hypothetical protein n=1 Tax=Haloferax sp. AB510 TaxID=2934172 RepID=UPI00209C4333|nr:hypothetical protein [Haloferax sp. AB510]MCO8267340.1 hypothetical protein [Haloferax sp. AB510]